MAGITGGMAGAAFIGIDQIVFNGVCDSLSSSTAVLSGTVELGEVTSQITTLTNYRDEFQKLADVMEQYKALLLRDIQTIRKAQKTLTLADHTGS